MRKTGLLLGLASAIALSTGCSQLPTSQQATGSNGENYQIAQRGGLLEDRRDDRIGDRRDGRIGDRTRDRIGDRRDGFDRRDGRTRDRIGDRDGSRFRLRRPGWWGRRAWIGRNVRPIWWGRRNYVVNRFIILGGYYYPFFIDDGYYYPDFTSPYVYVNGVYRPHYRSQPYVSTNAIPARSAQIVNYGPSQLEIDD